MVYASDNRSIASDLAARLSCVVAWIATGVTVLLLIVVGILVVITPRHQGWSSLFGLLWILLAVAGIAVSSLIGTIGAVIALRSRDTGADRRSLRVSLAVNGTALLAVVSLYAVASMMSRPAPREMFIQGSGVWFRPGDQETVRLQIQWNDGNDTREPPPAEWSSSDTAVFTVAGSGSRAVITAVAPGTAMLRVVTRTAGAEQEVRVAEVAPAPEAGPSDVGGGVVISQFRFAGPRGEDDDFVEVRNRAERIVDISGWSLAVSDGRGAAVPVGRVPPGISLEPGCPYLFASARQLFGDRARANLAYDFVSGDFPFWPPLATEGGLALVDPAGRIVDQVGSAGSRYVEGTPLPPNRFLTGGSYTRQRDTNDNAADFSPAAKASPVSFGSTCGRYSSLAQGRSSKP